MIIEELIKRECCQSQDLIDSKAYEGYFFCKHCGQLWQWDRKLDAAGSLDDILIKVKIERQQP
jgi:hypothetical protein